MIKRVTAIIFILLANIILLAHAVIPHLHNDGLPSLVKPHSAHSHSCHFEGHDHNTSDHEPDTNNDVYACILKQVIYPPTNNPHRLDCQCNNCNGDFHSYQAILLSLYRFTSNIPIQQTTGAPPFVQSFYSVHVSQSSGLRAPPFA